MFQQPASVMGPRDNNDVDGITAIDEDTGAGVEMNAGGKWQCHDFHSLINVCNCSSIIQGGPPDWIIGVG